MKVKIKKLHPDAVIPYKSHNTDFCYDFVAVTEEEIAPNVWKYGLGVACQIERGAELIQSELVAEDAAKRTYFLPSSSPVNLSLDLRPRSSIYKTGMALSNSIGTIDEGYTNEISVVFYHVMPNLPRYRVGERVCQGKIGVTFPIEFEEVKELSKTERGDGGYGSTGR